ncbi:MAG: hypothetical protein ACOYMN_15055 [Roseimicrobium sp.]
MKFPQFAVAFFLFPVFLSADDGDVRRELERTYSQWRSAIVSRSLSGWQQTTAAHRQMLTRNLIVSQKQPFPNALFDLPIQPAETTTLRFLQANVKGNTAQLAYFGKVDLGLVEPSEVPEDVLLLKFVKEATGWKFDTFRLMNLAGAPEVRAALQHGGSSSFLNEPSLTPDGVVPPTPKACPVPERIGVLQIASIGYATKATVNGFDIATVKENAEEHIIIGGLKDGDNPLTLAIEELPIPSDAERALEVHALVLTGDQKKPTIRVFSWKPEGKTPPTQAKLTIYVNRITLRD